MAHHCSNSDGPGAAPGVANSKRAADHHSAADFLRLMGYDRQGGRYSTLRPQMHALAACRLQLGFKGRTFNGQIEFAELLKQKEEIEAQLRAVSDKAREEAIVEIAEKIKTLNLSKEDLNEAYEIGTGKVKKKPEAKYKNPETGETWSGRGKPPLWISTAPDRTVFAIKKQAE